MADSERLSRSMDGGVSSLLGRFSNGPMRKSPMLARTATATDDTAVLTVYSRASQLNLAGASNAGAERETNNDLEAPLLETPRTPMQNQQDQFFQRKLDLACKLPG